MPALSSRRHSLLLCFIATNQFYSLHSAPAGRPISRSQGSSSSSGGRPSARFEANRAATGRRLRSASALNLAALMIKAQVAPLSASHFLLRQRRRRRRQPAGRRRRQSRQLRTENSNNLLLTGVSADERIVIGSAATSLLRRPRRLSRPSQPSRANRAEPAGQSAGSERTRLKPLTGGGK